MQASNRTPAALLAHLLTDSSPLARAADRSSNEPARSMRRGWAAHGTHRGTGELGKRRTLGRCPIWRLGAASTTCDARACLNAVVLLCLSGGSHGRRRGKRFELSALRCRLRRHRRPPTSPRSPHRPSDAANTQVDESTPDYATPTGLAPLLRRPAAPGLRRWFRADGKGGHLCLFLGHLCLFSGSLVSFLLSEGNSLEREAPW